MKIEVRYGLVGWRYCVPERALPSTWTGVIVRITYCVLRTLKGILRIAYSKWHYNPIYL